MSARAVSPEELRQQIARNAFIEALEETSEQDAFKVCPSNGTLGSGIIAGRNTLIRRLRAVGGEQ